MRRLFLGLICLILSLSVARAQAPAPAAAVGYNTQTFGSGVTVGTTPNPATSYPVFTTNRWAPYAFPGSSWTNIGFTTNSDGSVSMDGTGQAFGDGLATASPGPAGGPRTTFGGQTFGGGFYAVARMKGTGPMSFWANDVETQNGVSQGIGYNPWQPTQAVPAGQVNYGNWMELDMSEFDSTGNYGGAMHNWYAGPICSGNPFGTNSLSPPGNQQCGINSINSGSTFNAPPTNCCGGADFTQYHDYGFLWVPATGGSGGSTNILPNSAMAGAVVGSPGTLPTGWIVTSTGGLSYAVAGTGTDSTTGKTYTRLRVFGTPNGTGDFNLALANPSVPGAASSNYTESAGIGVSSGSLTNAGTVALIANDFDAGNNYLQGALYNPVTATGTVTTYSGSFLTTAATVNVSVGISLLGPTNGGAVDVTLQIENPQLLAASASTGQGYAKWFFDGVQVGNTYTWNKFDPTLQPPPVDTGSGGSSAYSVLDTLHMYLILGGSPGSTTTVSSVQVWQANGSGDLPVIGSHGESPDQTVVTTAGPTITDANGTIFAISSGAQILINGTADATTANVVQLAYVNHVLWQQNSAGNWYNYLGTLGSYGGPTTTSPLTGAGTSTIAVNAISTQTASAAFTVSGTVLSGTDWSINPGQDGSFWKQPFQTSAAWITSGPLITALRAGTPSINVKGNFGVPWVTGRATDPLVRVTDGTRSINVRMPLGTIIETPTSAFDQSIGGTDASQPYLVWSISGATMNTGSVQASGSVITGTYGFSIQDGSGLMMADKVTGVLGSNNSIGGIQPYDLAQILANPNYVIPHMLAFQLDSNTQASSAGPIWPLNLTDTSGGSYAGQIPQGVTIGIPANVVMPTGKTRAFKALWDQLQQQGMFNYNFGATGGVNFSVYDQSGAYASLITDLQAAWVEIGQNYLSILNYNSGVFGAQYSLATTKGAVAGSANAYPAPPLLNLSPTGGVNVAPSTFGAWYPNTSYSATPTNPGAPSGIPTLQYRDGSGAWQALPGGATVTGTTFSFTHPGIAATSSGQISVRDANFPTVVGVSNTFVVSGGSSGPAATGAIATVDFTNLTGQTVPNTVWGVGAGLYMNNMGALSTNTTFNTLASTLNIPLFRMNAQSGAASVGGYLTGGVWASGNINTPDWTFMNGFLKAPVSAGGFLPAGAKVIWGATPTKSSGSTLTGTWSAAEFQSLVTQSINWFKANLPTLTLYGFELSNEPDQGNANGLTASQVTTYTNAMAAGIAASNNPNVLVMGPTTAGSGGEAALIAAMAATGHLQVLDVHDYLSAPGISTANALSHNGTLPNSPTTEEFYRRVHAMRTSLAGTPAANVPLDLGEWNLVNVPATGTGQLTSVGAAFNASTVIQMLNADPNLSFSANWEIFADGEYGLIQSSASTTLIPSGYVYQIGAQKVFGARGTETVASPTTTPLSILGVSGGNGVGSFAVMLANYSQSAAIPASGTATIGLSHWPVNTSGNATVSVFTVSPANPTGITTQATVTNGLLSISIPAQSVAVIYASVDTQPIPVPAPLTGTVTPNAWQAFDSTYAGVTLACGKPFHYILAQPPQYDGTLYKYPLYIWLHPDHSGDSWYLGDNNPLKQAGNEAGSFNTQAFQTRHPAFYVAPSADQTDGNGTLNSCTTQADSAVKNWGGWFNNGSTGSGTVYSGDTGPNTFAIVAMINDLKSRYSIDPARIYINGFSLGGIYTDYACLHYNAYTGDKGKIFAACAGSAGVNQANSPPSNAAAVAMQNVPQWMFSGVNDGASPPGSWNSPLCTALGGSPSSLTGITSAAANQCGTSAMRYTLCPTCGHQDTDASGNPVWSNQIINDFLFAQTAGSVAGGCGGGAESANLATVTTVGPSITDANANTFAISSGGLILICGTADATTANVIELAYVNHVVWQKNAAGNWYSYNGTPGSYNGPTTTSPLPTESPNNTSVTTVGPQITNANLTTFSISAGAQILINGVADTATANVVQLAYVNHVLWQRNTAGNWYNYLGSPGSYGGPTMNSPLTSGCGGGGGTGSFTVSGGHILAPNGSVFKGIGLNIGDFRSGLDMASAVTNFTTGAPLTTLFPGINFVRLALYGGGSDTSPTTYPVPSSYDAFVNTVTGLGIVVEFEHHIGTTGSSAGGGQGVVPAPGSAWVNAENANYAALAAHFKNNPRVWFGTNNEPPSATGLSQWQQSNYNAIRGTGNTNPIMLEVWGSRPPGYGGTTLQAGMVQSIYSAMTNVIWDPHVYPFINNNNTSQAVNNQTSLDMISAAQSITSADGLVPVIIGEYGPSTTGSSIEANATQNVTGVLNSGVGSAVWHWGQQDCCNNTNNGNTLTALGTQVAAAIAANPVTVPVGLCKGHPMTLIFGANDNKLPAQRRAS